MTDQTLAYAARVTNAISLEQPDKWQVPGYPAILTSSELLVMAAQQVCPLSLGSETNGNV